MLLKEISEVYMNKVLFLLSTDIKITSISNHSPQPPTPPPTFLKS